MKLATFLATIPALTMAMEIPNVDIDASSETGIRILSKARLLEENDGFSATWVSGYSLKFHSCTASQDYYGGYFANGEGGGGENNGGNYYYNNEQREGYQGMYVKQLVHFRLCPSGSCTLCNNGADYVVELSDFVDAYLESKMTAIQYKCEVVRENCYCENAYSKDACLYGCMANAGLAESDCVEEGNNGAFDIQEAVECSKLELNEDAVQQYWYANGYVQGENQQQGGQNRKEVFVGPYCAANGRSIHLGVFTDETCSFPAPKGIYEALHYGNSLPYSRKSIVDSGCVSCMEPSAVNEQNQWDQEDADSVTQVCSSLYSSAAKCEEKLKGYMPYRDNYGCAYIKSLKATSVVPGANITAKAFAGIFGITTIVLAAVAVVLGRKSSRQNISLTGAEALA